MKYYVVFKGRTPGIYQNWTECQKQINKFKGAEHKSYLSVEAAEEAYYGQDYIVNSENNEQAQEGNLLLNHFDYSIFCDGACRGNPGPAGSGVAIYQRELLDLLLYGSYNSFSTNNAAELLALHEALLWAENYINNGLSVQIYCDSSYAINAVTDWSFSWSDNGWKKNKGAIENLHLIQGCHQLFVSLQGKVAIKHIKAHAGIEGNELADRMANYAVDSKMSSFAQFHEPMSINDLLKMANN
jgi:ribonuclease HI